MKDITLFKESALEIKIKGWFYFLGGIFLLALLLVNAPWVFDQIIAGTLFDTLTH